MIWFGTDRGVARYDGARFVSFTRREGLRPQQAAAIHVDPDGIVWIGSPQGESMGMSRFDGKTFVNFVTADGLPHPDIMCFASGPDGTLWVGGSTFAVLLPIRTPHEEPPGSRG